MEEEIRNENKKETPDSNLINENQEEIDKYKILAKYLVLRYVRDVLKDQSLYDALCKACAKEREE